MRQRDRKRMTGEQFRDALAQIGLEVSAFAWLTGSDPRRVERWSAGAEDIPPWVALMCGLMTLPGGAEIATSIARSMTVKEPTGV